MDISVKMCVNSVGTTSVGTVQSRRELDGSVRFRGREGELEPGLDNREEQAREDGSVRGSDAELTWLLALGLNGHHSGFLCVWRTGFLHWGTGKSTNSQILILGFYLTSHSS